MCGILNKWLLLFFLNFFTLIASAVTETGNTDKTLPIKGIPPYMQSIAAAQDQSFNFVYNTKGQPITFAGAVLHVPTKYCDNTNTVVQSEIIDYFNMNDLDGDLCAFDEIHEVEWYILDSDGKNWSSILGWDDLKKTKIDNDTFPGSILPPIMTSPSKYSNRLVIPDSAVNKRIGFTYQPKTKTGLPALGPIIKVWDLNYSFKQKMNVEVGVMDEKNYGEKNQPTNFFSGGGVVYPNFKKPEVKNLYISGDFMPGKQLSANYIFEANNSNIKTEVLRFWWEFDEQKEIINKDNSNYSLSPQSDVIKLEDLGRTIFVTALPILVTNNDLFIVGDPVTTSTIANESKVKHFPFIENLKIVEPVKLNQKITASYDYKYFGKDGSFDKSEYVWQIINNDNTLERSENGIVTQSGRVEYSSVIGIEHAGKILRVVMTPKTSKGTIGTQVNSRSPIEKIALLQITPRTGTLTVGKNETLALRAVAQYNQGYITEVTSLGQWRSFDGDILVSPNGVLKLSPTARVKKTVDVEFSFQGLTDKITIDILPADPVVSNVVFSREAMFGTAISAEYQFEFTEVDNDKDNSSYSWFYYLKDGTKHVLKSGEIEIPGRIPSVTLEPWNNGVEVEDLRLSITPKTVSGRTGQIATFNTHVNLYQIKIDVVDGVKLGEETTIIITVTDANNQPVKYVPFVFSALDTVIETRGTSGVTDIEGQIILIVDNVGKRKGVFPVLVTGPRFNKIVELKFL